jgi:hypothetical protein
MSTSQELAAAWRAARDRGDQEAADQLYQQLRDHMQANRRLAPPQTNPPRPLDCRGDLRWERVRNDPQAARDVVRDAVRQNEAHTLAPEDLIWLVDRLGPIRSGAGIAIAEWLSHRGPVHPELVQTAEDVAACDDSPELDKLLLWIEPTPDRWLQCALWVRVHIDWMMAAELKRAGREMPEILISADDIALYKSMVGTPDYVERLLTERGEAARRSLAAAPNEARRGSTVRCVLEVWAVAAR